MLVAAVTRSWDTKPVLFCAWTSCKRCYRRGVFWTCKYNLSCIKYISWPDDRAKPLIICRAPLPTGGPLSPQGHNLAWPHLQRLVVHVVVVRVCDRGVKEFCLIKHNILQTIKMQTLMKNVFSAGYWWELHKTVVPKVSSYVLCFSNMFSDSKLSSGGFLSRCLHANLSFFFSKIYIRFF